MIFKSNFTDRNVKELDLKKQTKKQQQQNK